jgi:hypothetical protein
VRKAASIAQASSKNLLWTRVSERGKRTLTMDKYRWSIRVYALQLTERQTALG